MQAILLHLCCTALCRVFFVGTNTNLDAEKEMHQFALRSIEHDSCTSVCLTWCATKWSFCFFADKSRKVSAGKEKTFKQNQARIDPCACIFWLPWKKCVCRFLLVIGGTTRKPTENCSLFTCFDEHRVKIRLYSVFLPVQTELLRQESIVFHLFSRSGYHNFSWRTNIFGFWRNQWCASEPITYLLAHPCSVSGTDNGGKN